MPNSKDIESDLQAKRQESEAPPKEQSVSLARNRDGTTMAAAEQRKQFLQEDREKRGIGELFDKGEKELDDPFARGRIQRLAMLFFSNN